MDSTGLRFALKWTEAAGQGGFEISFVPGGPAVQRVRGHWYERAAAVHPS
jgi:hypothetical protein